MKIFMATIVIFATMAVQIHAAPVDMIPGPNNIAQGALATSNQALWNNDTPSKLTDGALNNQVHGVLAPADGFSYTIDLGATNSFDEIKIFPRQDGCCPDRLEDVRLSVHSDDGAGGVGVEVWSKDIFQGVDANPPTNSGAVHSFLEADGTGTYNGRFIKLTSNQSPIHAYGLQIAEVEVHVPSGTMIPKNHALNAPVTPSGTMYSVAQGADKLTDGSDLTIGHPASGQQDGFSYIIEMENPVEIDNINVKGRADGCVCSDRLLDYRLEVFDVDPAVGTPDPVFTQDALGLTDENARVDNYPAIDKTGQWIKITNLSLVDFSPQIAEVEVFGHAITTPTSIPGDINDDKTVDAADITDFINFYGFSGFGDVTTGDFNGDMQTDLADLLIIKQHFGETLLPAPTATAVPEPTSVMLLLLSLLGLVTYGYRRKKN